MIDKYGDINHIMLMRIALILFPALLLPAAPALASNAGHSIKEATVQQGKPPARKAPESRDRKRLPSSAVGRGCLGCILPLDGIASTMAVRSAG